MYLNVVGPAGHAVPANDTRSRPSTASEITKKYWKQIIIIQVLLHLIYDIASRNKLMVKFKNE